MKKNNGLTKLTVFVLLLTIVAISLVSGTYAKYTSTAAGSDTATVAKWAFNVTDETGAVNIAGTTEKELTFDIFSTLTGETNVAKTDGSLIAPGTTGSFSFELENVSEVNAQYKVEYSIPTDGNVSNVPVEFSTDNATWSSDINSVAQAFTAIDMGETLETTPIYWRWAFTDDTSEDATAARDAADTALGVMETLPKVTVNAKITVEQVD